MNTQGDKFEKLCDEAVSENFIVRKADSPEAIEARKRQASGHISDNACSD